MIKYMIYNVQG